MAEPARRASWPTPAPSSYALISMKQKKYCRAQQDRYRKEVSLSWERRGSRTGAQATNQSASDNAALPQELHCSFGRPYAFSYVQIDFLSQFLIQ
eukprot:g33425.t1